MARKRKGIPIHGWLVIDKPLGMSSAQVVGAVRRLTGAAKVGHAGTLDPLATGILPIALGEATKTVSWIMDGTKDYAFTVCFGAATTTDDAEGEVTETSEGRPSNEAIEAALEGFRGAITQVPPAFSAIKIAGKRAYALARAGAAPEMASRAVMVEAFSLENRPDPDTADFTARTGKGTYIRALARDLAVAVGTVGHVATLRRTRVGPFDQQAAISLETLEELGHSAALQEHLLGVETALDDIPALALTQAEARKLQQGQAVAALPVLEREGSDRVSQGDVVSALFDQKLIALVEIKGGEIRPVRVFNL